MDAARAGQPGPQVTHAHHGRTLQLPLVAASSSGAAQRGGDHVGVEDQSAAGGGGSDVDDLKKKNVIVVISIFPQTENKCYIKILWNFFDFLTSFIFAHKLKVILKLPGN